MPCGRAIASASSSSAAARARSPETSRRSSMVAPRVAGVRVPGKGTHALGERECVREVLLGLVEAVEQRRERSSRQSLLATSSTPFSARTGGAAERGRSRANCGLELGSFRRLSGKNFSGQFG